MERLRAHPVLMTFLAFAIATAAAVAIAAAYGWASFAAAWRHLAPGWIVLVLFGVVLGVPAYAVAYRTLARYGAGPRLRLPLVLRLVVAGFGPFTPRGGFVLDKRALHAIEGDQRSATIRVLALGALEWALLAPAAWLAAVILLGVGARGPMPSLMWPWAVIVPLGFAVGLWFAAPARRERIRCGSAKHRKVLARGLRAVDMLQSLATGFSSCWAAWLAVALYWTFEIAAFYGATRLVALHLGLGEAILAYATGYALTRRSIPLGGAGVTEVLMTFALHWVGQPVAAALAAVVLYRLFNFVLPALVALIVRPQVRPLLRAADEGRVPAPAERRRAAAPLVGIARDR